MTPKEKAKELVDKFNDCSRIYPSFIDNDFRLVNNSKQCALIALDEILDVLFMDINPIANYWFEVKQEIEKL